MRADDMPRDDAEPEVRDDEADASYQDGFDAASDGLRWVQGALSVLTAEVETGGPGEMDTREWIAARVEASRAIARLFRGIAADPAD